VPVDPVGLTQPGSLGSSCPPKAGKVPGPENTDVAGHLSTMSRDAPRAEREGFEPSDPVTQVNSLAVSPIRPLSHLSVPGKRHF
jgi:hypothetical protein